MKLKEYIKKQLQKDQYNLLGYKQKKTLKNSISQTEWTTESIMLARKQIDKL